MEAYRKISKLQDEVSKLRHPGPGDPLWEFFWNPENPDALRMKRMISEPADETFSYIFNKFYDPMSPILI